MLSDSYFNFVYCALRPFFGKLITLNGLFVQYYRIINMIAIFDFLKYHSYQYRYIATPPIHMILLKGLFVTFF